MPEKLFLAGQRFTGILVLGDLKQNPILVGQEKKEKSGVGVRVLVV